MMSGILVRAAISIGLHRDGATFPNISYFEAEMRRRIWWHICCFDARVSQCYAPETMISNSMLDTREPTNCNDVDIDLSMKKEPTARDGFTDVSFTLLACELRRLCNHILSLMSTLLSSGERQQAAQREALRKIEEGRKWARTKIFRNAGPKRSIQPFTDFLFNLLLDQLGIIVRDTNIFGKWACTEEKESREQSFISALTLIRNMRKWRDQSSTRQWGWIFTNFQQWYAVGIILIHLQTQIWDSACERTWALAVKTLNDIPPAMMTQNPLRESITSMVAATRQHRQEELARQNVQPGNPPSVSLLPDDHTPIAVSADMWSSSTDLSASATFQRLPVDVAQNNLFESFHLPEEMYSDFSYPPWCMETTSDLDTADPSFGGSQESFFYNFLGGYAESVYQWPHSQSFDA